MMQLPGYNIWAFRGMDATTTTFRGRPIDTVSWYVGHTQGGDVVSGPHSSEQHALTDARLMTDTSGT